MISGEDQEGFLVSDGHLSDEEYNFSYEEQDGLDKKAEIELRRARYKENLKFAPQSNQFGNFLCLYNPEELVSYKAVCFLQLDFPINM